MSPIIATILLVAITVVLAAVLYILISGLTKGPGNQPIGSSLAIGTAAEAQKGANYYYNFTIESAGSGITWNSVNLQITNSGGLVSAGITSFTVYSVSFQSVCSSSSTTETSWTAGAAGSGSTLISSTQTLVVVTTINLANTGAQLNALGVGSFAGTTHATIP
ncbi:MAG TPA: archaellin/type IV pilin N-terminal domain-containing protein [Thermoplasmata archaeon]|nr:archaellin/type IV pilin N-terminal domain-containing protein [Thermoplasmata archaeon]